MSLKEVSMGVDRGFKSSKLKRRSIDSMYARCDMWMVPACRSRLISSPSIQCSSPRSVTSTCLRRPALNSSARSGLLAAMVHVDDGDLIHGLVALVEDGLVD